MATDLRIQLVDGAGEPEGRKPARNRVRLEERAIELLRPGGNDAMQTDRAGHGLLPVARLLRLSSGGQLPPPDTSMTNGAARPRHLSGIKILTVSISR